MEPLELDYATCLELLGSEDVARVAVCTPDGPRIVPVNYVVIAESVVFRTTPYSVLGTYGGKKEIAVEVDRLDRERKQGWSVVATGRGTVVDDDEELEEIRVAGGPEPWASGSRFLNIRLRWAQLTGRRLVALSAHTGGSSSGWVG